MKKLVSIILSVMMVFAVGCMSITALADDVYSPQPTPVIEVEVNGQKSNEVVFTQDPDDPMSFTFEYTGNMELIGWTFPDLVQDVDYVVVSQVGNVITIELTPSGATQTFAGNAIVEESSTDTTKKSSEKDNSGKSPATGATLAGIAVAGAGVAVLAALKKKND